MLGLVSDARQTQRRWGYLFSSVRGSVRVGRGNQRWAGVQGAALPGYRSFQYFFVNFFRCSSSSPLGGDPVAVLAGSEAFAGSAGRADGSGWAAAGGSSSAASTKAMRRLISACLSSVASSLLRLPLV